MTFKDQSYDLSNTSKKEIADLRKHTGFVFQNYNLFANKTALQNVTLGLTVARNVSKEDADLIGMQMLEKVGMQDRSNHYPSQLSGGQQQRVTIGRAIANKPMVLIADEPTGNLDPEKSLEIITLLEKINKKLDTTIMMVTHDKVLVDRFKKRTIMLDKGYVIHDSNRGGYKSL